MTWKCPFARGSSDLGQINQDLQREVVAGRPLSNFRVGDDWGANGPARNAVWPRARLCALAPVTRSAGASYM